MPNLSPSLTQTPLSQMLNLSFSHRGLSLSQMLNHHQRMESFNRGCQLHHHAKAFPILSVTVFLNASLFSLLFFFFGCFCFHRSGEENEDIFFQWWREWDFGSEIFSMLGVIFSFVWMFFVFGGEGNEDRDFCSEICSRRVKTNEWIKNW